MSCFWIAAWSFAFPYFTQDWIILDAVWELASSATRSPHNWIIWGTSSRFLSFGVVPWRSTSHKAVASWITWKFFCLFALLSFRISFLFSLHSQCPRNQIMFKNLLACKEMPWRMSRYPPSPFKTWQNQTTNLLFDYKKYLLDASWLCFAVLFDVCVCLCVPSRFWPIWSSSSDHLQIFNLLYIVSDWSKYRRNNETTIIFRQLLTSLGKEELML